MSSKFGVDYSRLDTLIEFINSEFNGILRKNLYEVGMSKQELIKLRAKKREVREALSNCGIGDLFAKDFIKSSIKNMLTEKLEIREEEINKIIPFNNSKGMSGRDMYDILIYLYKGKYGNRGFVNMLDEYDLLEPIESEDGFAYHIDFEDILEIYNDKTIALSFDEKLDIVTQRLYESYRGLGCVDELRDMSIDGVSGGVSGSEGRFDSVWAFIKGKTVHLKFLDFENEKELERVCMNIYRYNHPGHLSMAKGYIVNEMKDHSRVVVARPPFCESFVFFVRKFDTIEKKDLKELITDNNAETAIETMKWIVKGCQVCAITGTQGSGKTTLLMALIKYINPAYTLRIQEMAFELHLRDVYEDRNIVTFQETDMISGQEGLDLQKKTDGSVNILGEVASAPVASWMIQMAMVASLFTMFTHHAKTTDNLIKYLRNCLLTDGAFRNESVAMEQVVDVVRFDIHMEKDILGHRYIERITEIIPCKDGYKLNNIVEYHDGEYVKTGEFSETMKKEIVKHLSKGDMLKFVEEYNLQGA